ncbi:MAG: class I SAM-dependent methyltransferase [Actinomycetota bacterium]|jgi:SAM-dependent methyltransferase|nr:class I SAM-dependent methyltransferase [Actinomycetota bacterium]
MHERERAGRPTAFDGETYQARFDALVDQGVDVHGEATFVLSFGPRSVLDAGCGTGRVAIELARQGVEVVGVDVDSSMLAEARRRGPGIGWVEADLAALELGRAFNVVVLAGNVPIFCPPSSRVALVRSCAAHVAPTGVLVAGFQLDRGYGLDEWDEACAAAGLQLDQRWSAWDREPFEPGREYAVSVHRHRAAGAGLRPLSPPTGGQRSTAPSS